MAVFNEPTKWAQTLGKDADVTTIPDTAGETDPSIDKIFPSIFSIPLARGGRAIPRSVLNGLFKLLGDNIFYLQQGGVFSYSDTANYGRGAFVKYNNELYLCIQDNSSLNKHAPTDAKYWEKITTFKNSVMTGTLLPFAGSDIPTGYLLCNGVEVSKADYSELYSVISNTYGTASSSDKFKLPDFRDRFIEGANSNLGVYLDAGLPNITGNTNSTIITSNTENAPVGSGAFIFGASAKAGAISNSYECVELLFNASKSNSIYGNSRTVQPPALAVNILIKY